MFRVNKEFKPRKEFKERKLVDRPGKGAVKTFVTQTDGISQDEHNQWKQATECMRCAWPADRKGNHKTMDCCRPDETDTGTGDFPNAKQYQKWRVGACGLEEDQMDPYTEESESKELRDTPSGSSEESESSESADQSAESSERMANWWSD